MITQEFDLNMIPDSEPVVVHVNQYDTGQGRLIAHLYDKDQPYSPTGATVVIQGTKPDRHGFAYNATISGNTVTATLTEQMTAVKGITRTQILVNDTYGRTGTFVFALCVQESALQDDTDISETELPAIIDLARHNADIAVAAAEDAAQSEINAKASEDAAALSESNAANSASAAADSESNAADSATAAATSEANAYDSEQEAKASEQAAKASEEILQYYVDFVIPRFIIANNRLYISNAAEGEFIVANNRLYIKNAS